MADLVGGATLNVSTGGTALPVPLRTGELAFATDANLTVGIAGGVTVTTGLADSISVTEDVTVGRDLFANRNIEFPAAATPRDGVIINLNQGQALDLLVTPAGGGQRGLRVLSDGTLVPAGPSGVMDIGTAAFRYRSGYFQSKLYTPELSVTRIVEQTLDTGVEIDGVKLYGGMIGIGLAGNAPTHSIEVTGTALMDVELAAGSNNVAFGKGSLANVTGSHNTAMGGNALTALNSGRFNTAVGFDALLACTNGEDNIAIGVTAMSRLTTGDRNIGIGNNALNQLTTGSGNVSVGSFRGIEGSFDITTASDYIVLSNCASTPRVGLHIKPDGQICAGTEENGWSSYVTDFTAPSDTQIASTQAIQNAIDASVSTAGLIGQVIDFAGQEASIPDGWLACDGRALTIGEAAYDALFHVIGTTWNTSNGNPDPGEGMFRIPDLRGDVIVGKDDMGGRGVAGRVTFAASGIDGTEVGGFGGDQTVTLNIDQMPVHSHNTDDHSHTTQDHAHDVPRETGQGTEPGVLFGQIKHQSGEVWTTNSTNVTVDEASVTIQDAGGGGPHLNMQPSVVMLKIIKYA